ncbi:hypothetical protein PTQ21_00775 [Paenibacillus marchantiae]|uniref:hypothetical protein n=1 Tax=Paenibacillus marchantiae TaxID=3026433 RepID=UPI00237B5799|nr:hypothetical protein [Paenibacillus marchantiae]WDQ36021.1 hypothetical protein PTQ21_00775 [Paenibacillus marchantiae]
MEWRSGINGIKSRRISAGDGWKKSGKPLREQRFFWCSSLTDTYLIFLIGKIGNISFQKRHLVREYGKHTPPCHDI